MSTSSESRPSAAGEDELNRAAEDGDPEAMFALAVYYGRRERMDEAQRALRDAANHRHPRGVRLLIGVLRHNGTPQETHEAELWERVAEDAEPAAMRSLGELFHAQGEIDDAEVWLRAAADTGDTEAMTLLAEELHDEGDDEEAEAWEYLADHPDDDEARADLARLLEERGRIEESQTWQP